MPLSPAKTLAKWRTFSVVQVSKETVHVFPCLLGSWDQDKHANSTARNSWGRSGLEALSDDESSAAVAIAKKISFSTGECLLSARQGRIG